MKRNIRYINIIFFALTFGLLLASCSMAGAQKESSVSFKLDSETVQKIRNAAGKTAKPNARAADDDNLFVEVAVHGGYEDSDIVPLQEEAIVSIDKIPVGSEIYVEATAFKQTGETRQDLYKGQSKTFKVLNSDNFVMFIMHKVAGSESSGGGNSGGSNGTGSNGTGGNGTGGSGTGGSGGGNSGGGNGTSGFSITISSGITNGSVSTNVTSAQENASISITVNPARGYMINSLTVEGADSTAITVERENGSRTFTMPAQNVTVNASFKQVPYTLLPEGTDGSAGTEATYATFGMWPQTIMGSGVTVDQANAQTEVHGEFTYYKGSDGNWYVKCDEYANGDNYHYSDGSSVAKNGANYKWFKVEPIKWRVLTIDYDHDQDATTEYAHLLMAESILTNYAYYDYSYVKRSIGGTDNIYSHNYEHSKLRAYLNGIAYEIKETESSTQSTSQTHLNKGFLQSAFSETEQNLIATTLVDNSAASLSDAKGRLHTNPDFVCSDTSDKLFLLSEKEITNENWGFVENDGTNYSNWDDDSPVGNSDPTRIRHSTDYALAHGSFENPDSSSGGGYWERSPDDYYQGCSGTVAWGGCDNYSEEVDRSYNGVVPAFCVN